MSDATPLSANLINYIVQHGRLPEISAVTFSEERADEFLYIVLDIMVPKTWHSTKKLYTDNLDLIDDPDTIKEVLEYNKLANTNINLRTCSYQIPEDAVTFPVCKITPAGQKTYFRRIAPKKLSKKWIIPNYSYIFPINAVHPDYMGKAVGISKIIFVDFGAEYDAQETDQGRGAVVGLCTHISNLKITL